MTSPSSGKVKATENVEKAWRNLFISSELLVKYLNTESRIFRRVPSIPLCLRVKFAQIIWIVIGNGEYKLIVCCTLVSFIIYLHYKLMRHLFRRTFPRAEFPPPLYHH